MTDTETAVVPEHEQAKETEARETTWGRWWRELESRRGDRAELRRCESVLDVALTPAFHGLLRRLGSRLKETDRDRVAAVAGLLAHVEKDSGARSMGDALAAEHNGKARLSDLRFRKLLKLETPDELLRELVRVARLLDGALPVDALARDVMAWDDGVKKRWALDYYARAEAMTRNNA